MNDHQVLVIQLVVDSIMVKIIISVLHSEINNLVLRSVDVYALADISG